MKLLNKLFSIKNESYKKVIRVLGLKFTISRCSLQRVKKFNNSKPTIAFQLGLMDKGGLEEVVLQLANSELIKEKYNTVIICEFNSKGYLADIARKQGIPVYSFFNKTSYIPKLVKKLNIKMVHFHYSFSGAEEYKKLNIKTIYTVHNNYIWFDKEGAEKRSQEYKYIDKFVAVSSQVRNYFINKFNVDESKVIAIPNGIEYIDTTDIEPVKKEEVGLKEDDFVITSVASFSLYKYHYPQILAVSKLSKKYPNIKLLLIGNIAENDYYNNLLDFIKEHNAENNVKIINYMPKQEVYKYLKMTDCYIMTSLTEGFSIAMSEAMMLGAPMIITDIGGARDAIKDNDIGLIVNHAFSNLQDLNINTVRDEMNNNIYHLENVDEITNAIEDMYLNKDKWKEKALQGREKIKSMFNVKRVQRDYFEQYNELLEGYGIK